MQNIVAIYTDSSSPVLPNFYTGHGSYLTLAPHSTVTHPKEWCTSSDHCYFIKKILLILKLTFFMVLLWNCLELCLVALFNFRYLELAARMFFFVMYLVG